MTTTCTPGNPCHVCDFCKSAAEPIAGTFTPTVAPVTPFPVRALPRAMRRMVVAVAGNKQVPRDLPAVFALGAVSTVAAPYVAIARGAGWVEPLNLYLAIVMDSGTGKTPAEKDVVRPLWAIEAQMRTAYAEILDRQIDELDAERGPAAGNAAKANRIETKIKELEDDKRRPPDLISGSDITMEALVREMERNGGHAAILDSEGEFFALMSGRYNGGNPNLGITLKAYDGDRYRVRRIGRDGADVERSILTLALGIQPIVMEEAAKNPAMVERGLLNRFLFAIPESLVGTRDEEGTPYDQEAMDGWAQAIENLYITVNAAEPDEYGNLPTLTLTPQARARHVEFCGWIERRLHPDDGDLGTLAGWATKHKARALRLAGLLHLIDGNAIAAPVSEQTMNNAVEISKWAIGPAVRVFGTGAGSIEVEDQQCLDVIAWIRRRGPGDFNTRDVRRGCRKKWLNEEGVAALLPVLERLVDDRVIAASETRDKQGHRLMVYRPNPQLFQEAV